MTQRTDAEFFQVRVSEIAKNREINVVFSERRCVLSEAAAVVGAVVPAAPLFALAKTQPAKPPMTKMTASRSVKPMIAPVRSPLLSLMGEKETALSARIAIGFGAARDAKHRPGFPLDPPRAIKVECDLRAR